MINSYDPNDNFENLENTNYFNTDTESNSFLFLSAHRDDYFNKISKKLDKSSKNYEGYLLDKYFFSSENIEIIQKQVILGVFQQSNKEFLIPPQNINSIETVMKYIYNKYSKNLPYDITGQVRELNTLIEKELVPMIINNCKARQQYIKTINSPPPTGPELPTNINSSGNRTLPSVTTTF